MMIYQFLKPRLVMSILLYISASKALPFPSLTNQLECIFSMLKHHAAEILPGENIASELLPSCEKQSAEKFQWIPKKQTEVKAKRVFVPISNTLNWPRSLARTGNTLLTLVNAPQQSINITNINDLNIQGSEISTYSKERPSFAPMTSECIDYLFDNYSKYLEAYVKSKNLGDNDSHYDFSEYEDKAMAVIAIKSLSLCGSESVPILRASLRSLLEQEKGPIIEIINSLGNIGEDASESLPELIHTLNYGAIPQRCAAAKSIGQISNENTFMINSIYNLLEDIEVEIDANFTGLAAHAQCRRVIFQALGLLGETDFSVNSLLQELESTASISEGIALIDLLKPLELNSNMLASRLIRSINQRSTSREGKISLILALGILASDYGNFVNALDTIAYNSIDSSLLASTAFSLVITGNSEKGAVHLIKSLKNLPEAPMSWGYEYNLFSLQLFIANNLNAEGKMLLGKDLASLVRKSGLKTQEKSLKILRSIEFSNPEYIDYLFEVSIREECSQSFISSPAVVARAMTAFCSTETLRFEAIKNLGEIERKDDCNEIRNFLFQVSLSPGIDLPIKQEVMYELSRSPFIDDNIFDHFIDFINEIGEVTTTWNEARYFLSELNIISELDNYFLRLDVDSEAMRQSISELRESSSINDINLKFLYVFHEINEQMRNRAKIIDNLAENLDSERRKRKLANILTKILEETSYYDTDFIHSSVFALGEMRIEDPLVVDVLTLVFSQGNPKTKLIAAEALGKVSELDTAISHLLDILENEEKFYSTLFSYGIHKEVVLAFKNLGSPATINLADKLSAWENLSLTELRSVVYSLSQLKDIPVSSIPSLIEILSDRSLDLKTRRFAAYALDTFEAQQVENQWFYKEYNLIPAHKVDCESLFDDALFDSYLGRCTRPDGLNGGADLLLRIQCLLGRC